MIGMLTFLNPPRRGKARVRRRRISRIAREGKEKVMARTRVRRRRRRGVRRLRSGRFAPKVFRVRRRRRRTRRNPLFRSRRSGRFKGSAPGRRLHRRRRGRLAGTWHMNPRRRRRSRRRRMMMNPLFGFMGGGRKRRRRSGGTRRRRRARRNPSYGGRRRVRLLSNPVDAIMGVFKEAFSGDTLETAIHTGIGFGGVAAGSRLVYKQLITGLDTPIGRVGTHFGATIIETLLLGWLGGSKLAARALTGGLIATVWQGVSELVRGTKAGEWIPTLGDSESEEFRKAIEAEVLKEIRGGGGGSSMTDEGVSVYLQPAGVSDTYLEPAGAQAYLTEREAENASGMNAYLTQREVDVTTGIGDVESEFGTTSLPERF